jgi:predicted DCC family thiol-disulfide oxidoreductase YuxK
LCHVSKLRAERWAEQAGQALRVDVLQSAEAITKGYGDAMVLEADRVYFGADAWLKLMTLSPWYLRWLAWLGRWPLVGPLMKFGYAVVARYRKKWFGSRACPVPSTRQN